MPFVKNPLLWEDIHSMETYKKMTQKPHFAPLYEHIEEEREGLAVVYVMGLGFINFVNSKYTRLYNKTNNKNFISEIQSYSLIRASALLFSFSGFQTQYYILNTSRTSIYRPHIHAN